MARPRGSLFPHVGLSYRLLFGFTDLRASFAGPTPSLVLSFRDTFTTDICFPGGVFPHVLLPVFFSAPFCAAPAALRFRLPNLPRGGGFFPDLSVPSFLGGAWSVTPLKVVPQRRGGKNVSEYFDSPLGLVVARLWDPRTAPHLTSWLGGPFFIMKIFVGGFTKSACGFAGPGSGIDLANFFSIFDVPFIKSGLL